ncbi:hypothetical protein CBS63078_8619 [Aspergillus niger]|uniref:Major Facilitator Superfamily protein n=2 Tax=Aspergillus niger TaxID=5061 RepID=A0A254UKP7_ASPNG|nr:hypothetical protein ANI_1_1416134 [Aspergillus niger CBS 513.88]KAI2819950.1 hypothetical protein CBS115989_4087 [Aspergillus niger]RDH14995.1 hypothetical protein M747DRAFT_299781 [Aspergillus niger ATCC 13496]KAI2828531.1 hypothetical protein CBS133816_5361 [Aspergillus niger]KAI2843029.1 hypothetical protein CBS11232_8389 [Aspergillus niger]KAI2849517.1 hypothetical protein CBS11350_2059 [Aspergillus niger]|eukprot:XP_001396937.2 hypothetical protein ANI_1_1416134 [Aspergillus niger CBS 513.88]
MSDKWEVANFSLSTNVQNETEREIFANGNMQAQINVRIKATVYDTLNTPYQLTESDLESLKLIDYSTKEELAGKWTYSREEDEIFVHTMPGQLPSAAPVVPNADGSQTVVLWVSSTTLGDKRIAAQITELGEKPAIVTTTGGTYDSSITIVAKQPITYTMNDVTVTREDTAEGFWSKRVWFGNTEKRYEYAWDQDNYYIKSKLYPFVKVDPKNVDTDGTQQPYGRNTYFRDAFAYLGLGNNRDVSIFFMPQMGGSSTKWRGVYASNDYNIIDTCAKVTVNQRPNELCLTRLLFGNGWVSWYSNWQQDTWFTIYDQYGNPGYFSVKTNGSNTISISTRYVNEELSADSRTIESTSKL